MGGVVRSVVRSISRVLGGGGSEKVSVPKLPDYEAERKKAEEEAQRKRSHLAAQGMGGTVLGGSYGDGGNVSTKKLLGE